MWQMYAGSVARPLGALDANAVWRHVNARTQMLLIRIYVVGAYLTADTWMKDEGKRIDLIAFKWKWKFVLMFYGK